MKSIEYFNKYNFYNALEYMKKYVDITICEAKKDEISQALETIYIEEIIFFLKRFDISELDYKDKKFVKTLSLYLNEEVKSYIESKGYSAKDNYFMPDKSEKIVLN